MSAFLPPLFYGTFDLGKINYTKYYIIPSYHYSWARSHVFRSCAIKTDFFCILRVQHMSLLQLLVYMPHFLKEVMKVENVSYSCLLLS